MFCIQTLFSARKETGEISAGSVYKGIVQKEKYVNKPSFKNDTIANSFVAVFDISNVALTVIKKVLSAALLCERGAIHFTFAIISYVRHATLLGGNDQLQLNRESKLFVIIDQI